MDKNIASLVKGIAMQENGGKVDVKNTKQGKTGEAKSVFQFTPSTWKAYAKQISGNENLPMTPENEAIVAYHKIGDWYTSDIKEGYSPEEAQLRSASRWNAGPGEPNAYTGKFSDGSHSVGTNHKYGVKYDVPSYAKNVQQYAKQSITSNSASQPQAGLIPTPMPQAGAMKGVAQVPQKRPLVGTLVNASVPKVTNS